MFSFSDFSFHSAIGEILSSGFAGVMALIFQREIKANMFETLIKILEDITSKTFNFLGGIRGEFQGVTRISNESGKCNFGG